MCAVATAELELQVHATSGQPVEGRVGIALPSGAVVTGYALDVGGRMIDGSLVEAARAQAAYEQNVRRQVDVRVVIDWSNDAADIDLWVDEPSGERVIYSNPRSHIGGHLSNDMTASLRPEDYFIRRAAPGAYVAKANVFAPDRLDPNGPARVTAHLYRDWGRPMQREQLIDFDVSRGKDGQLTMGTLKVDEPGEK